MSALQYLIFDVESVADADLVSQVYYKGKVPREEAVQKYRAELFGKHGSDFIPYTYQKPISLAAIKVCADFTLHETEKTSALTVITGEPHIITDTFWHGCSAAYKDAVLVTFNGRGFDLPLMELAAFRYGISIPHWYRNDDKRDPRSRYNMTRHFDLCDKLTNFGATRFAGGLNLAATMLGKPGKMEVEGSMVQDMYDAGRIDEIHDYCRCDVLDTYFVFLRVMLLAGKMDVMDVSSVSSLRESRRDARLREREIVEQAKKWLETKRDEQNNAQSTAEKPIRAFEIYLNNWGDWENPWGEEKANEVK